MTGVSTPSTTPTSKMTAAWFAPMIIVNPSSSSNTRDLRPVAASLITTARDARRLAVPAPHSQRCGESAKAKRHQHVEGRVRIGPVAAEHDTDASQPLVERVRMDVQGLSCGGVLTAIRQVLLQRANEFAAPRLVVLDQRADGAVDERH